MRLKNKRILSFILGMNMIFSFAGCSKISNDLSNNDETNQLTTEESVTNNDDFVTDDDDFATDNDDVATDFNDTTTIETTTNPFISSEKTIYTTADLNLREKPSLDSNVLTVIGAYQKLKTIETSDDWYYVSYEDKKGYVSSKYVNELDDTYVEVDISDQNLYLYVDDELSLSADVVTGKKGVYDTRLGCNEIYSKQRKTYLKGDDYKVFVDFWMPFDGGQGLHDASWRDNFSSDAYLNGSHGCVNMKHDDAKYVYDNVSVGTKVLVHK